jgi:AcrR family transcriptional regulator
MDESSPDRQGFADSAGAGRAASGRVVGQVTRADVLAAALAIVDNDGVEGLSMRRLADVVGRDPMVIYRHVPNKAAVLDGVAELVLGQPRVDSSDPDWGGRLRIVAHTALDATAGRGERG